jgi:hypothetical protein
MGQAYKYGLKFNSLSIVYTLFNMLSTFKPIYNFKLQQNINSSHHVDTYKYPQT